MKDYKMILKEKKYTWKQILDTAGIRSATINIHKFPSNFLLDASGKILFIDITLQTLGEFLEKNLSTAPSAP